MRRLLALVLLVLAAVGARTPVATAQPDRSTTIYAYDGAVENAQTHRVGELPTTEAPRSLLSRASELERTIPSSADLVVAAETEAGVAEAGLPFHDAALESRVTSTLEDIENGVTRYRQDGTFFQNREGLLPKEGSGYYRKFTVDNPGVSGRGAERIVVGADGATYYTPDHYRSFVRIR